MTTLAIGSDHGGKELKDAVKAFLSASYPNIQVTDVGTHSTESCDYPDFGHKVAETILSKKSELGILICGTGIGISIAANRHKGIRAALVYNDFTAQMAKEHNNANILCLGARTTPENDALRYIKIWLDTAFEGGRHQNRLDKLDQ